ncbi:MAG: hypothetical protein KBC48_03295 [Candidatus Pacebacteria bacterium]|nr:hypothetical protein [Candidatus Paceibacterota bacterium]
MPYKPSAAELRRIIEEVFEMGMYIPELDETDFVERIHDDHDGSGQGRLQISILPHGGDMLVSTDKHQGPPLRFRSVNGGTQSFRTHMALRILMWAMIRDEQDRPQRPRT